MIHSVKKFLCYEQIFNAVLCGLLLLVPQSVLSSGQIPGKEITHLFTIYGEKSNPLSLPTDVAVDKKGNIYIVDSGNHRIAVFNQSGNNIGYISQPGSNQNSLLNPVGITVDENNIYIADKDNHRIQVFAHSGDYQTTIPLLQGKKPVRPVDVWVDKPANHIIVTGNNNHQLLIYNFAGKLIRSWGGEGTNRSEFRYPATIALYNDNIYVVDVLNSRVQIFNRSGDLQAIAGEWGVLPGQLFRPKGVALDSRGNIYVSDSYLGAVQVFASDTRFTHVLTQQNQIYKFTSPAGIAVDQYNRLYVCEMLANRVSVYSLEP